ncbi:hypothetical protein PV325_005744, partial [Microctonus aethiopoides]
VVIDAGMVGIIELLIIGFSCTNVTLGKYIIQQSTLNANKVTIPMAKYSIIESPMISETNYCVINECKTIICTSISSLDPGAVASNFISHIFKIQCPTTRIISNLIFQDCKFPDGKLKNCWLISNMKINEIRFENCELSEINIGAFAAKNFANTVSLTIINTQITILKSYYFNEMKKLRKLMIHDNIITEAEYNLLNAVSETLQIIELDRSIINPNVLLNITTGKQLSQVQLVSLQGNNIPNLSQAILNSFPNILSLYLDSSKIINVNVNTFTSINFIQQIFMNNNLIKTLPNGLFDNLLLHNPNFKLSVINNPWHCNCQLNWMQKMIIKYPKIFMTIPNCQTPEINGEKSFLNAEFCHESSDNVTTTENNTSIIINNSTQAQNNSKNDEKFIKILCQNSQLIQLEYLNKKFIYKSDNKLLKKSSQDFSLHQYNNGSVAVVINNYHETITTILWFNINEENDNKIKNINCIKTITKLTMLNNFLKDTTYIICVVEKIQSTPLPFNCLTFKTNEKIWLLNSDKSIILSIYSLTLILFGLFGSGICLLIVRRNPSLLRGSSRVIMVKQSCVKAMVLPKGINYSSIHNRRLNKKIIATPAAISNVTNNYLTPIETRTNYSSNIYESIYNETIDNNDLKLIKPPPLPPHPHHGIYQQLSSLSWKIDRQNSEIN